jgi:hypothetical protein
MYDLRYIHHSALCLLQDSIRYDYITTAHDLRACSTDQVGLDEKVAKASVMCSHALIKTDGVLMLPDRLSQYW